MVIITDILKASSSTVDPIYDVFLSFRGVDTRNNFTNHLHTALVNANLETFLDDHEIETGVYLKPELESAIRASRASVIVLSKNYASSTWCLNELVLILEQHTNFNQIVIPIFYHVEPTHVRKQQSTFGDAMEKHKQTMEAQTNEEEKSRLAEKMEIWIKALTQVSNLKGKEPKDKLETEFIEEIVKDVYIQLGGPLRINLPQDPQLTGVDDSVNVLSSWLKDGSEHTGDIFTILGIGGIGKTTLAKHVYNLHCHEFNRSSFIESISMRCALKSSGLLDVQKQLCGNISKESSIFPLHDVSVYTSTIEHAVARKKVFLVLDDIDSLDQLDALLGKKGFHPGSKIIITTKNGSLTERCALFNPQVHSKHTRHILEGLRVTESLKLLCFHAFKREDPFEGYEAVSDNIARYCEGHPLALKVLGRSLHNRDVSYWEDRIKELKKEPGSHIDDHIDDVLRIGFDSLPSKNAKELFKHICCFFVGESKDFTETILNACDINTRSGITDLIERCLLYIGSDNKLTMHSLIQKMGRHVVHQESPNKPWKRSRLWCHDESLNALKRKKAKENVLGLTLDMQMLEKEKLRRLFIETDAIGNMDNVMILHLDYVQINGSYANFPEEIRWLCMRGFPLKSMPLDMLLKNLVALDMSYSNIESFDMSCNNPQPLEGTQMLTRPCSKDDRLLGSLKILDLSYCYQLRSVGGFNELPALESLSLTNCMNLIEICDSIEDCEELVFIDLSNCKECRKLIRNLDKFKKVETLVLDGCDLGELPPEMMDITSQTSSSAIVEVLPKSLAISFWSSLVRLSLANNKMSNESFPMDLSFLSMLKVLNLDNNPFVSMPNCVRSLPRLIELSMDECKSLMSIEHPPRTLTRLSSLYNKCLRKIEFHPEMSPLILMNDNGVFGTSSIEIEGMIKIQPMAGVDETILSSLGWSNLDFIKKRRVGTLATHRMFSGYKESLTQMYYEFGIFSTFYGGEVMPNWIRHRIKGTSISFTIPSSSKKIRGLNFCYVLRLSNQLTTPTATLPHIIISNKTKNRTWIYKHYIYDVKVRGELLTFLSHWMFGKNDMEAGDHLDIILEVQFLVLGHEILECGVSIVYENEDGKNSEEDDVLSYYKSWNHIIGGDLSPFQSITGDYMLSSTQFRQNCKIYSNKDEDRRFKAFSQKKFKGKRLAENLDAANATKKFLLSTSTAAITNEEEDYEGEHELDSDEDVKKNGGNEIDRKGKGKMIKEEDDDDYECE